MQVCHFEHEPCNWSEKPGIILENFVEIRFRSKAFTEANGIMNYLVLYFSKTSVAGPRINWVRVRGELLSELSQGQKNSVLPDCERTRNIFFTF